jgi:hypothetical protein
MRCVWTAALASLVLLALGCERHESPNKGVLVVPFELGNRKQCKDLGVVGVRVELGDDGELAQEVDCSAGEVRFNLVPKGRYDVSVYGVDEDGVAIMDSLADGPASVDVVGGNTTVVLDPPAVLTASPAKLLLRWQFGFGSCESAAVGGFTVSAWRADGGELLMEADVPCDMPGEGRQQYRQVPDEGRDLSGDSVGEIDVQPYDVNDIAMGDPANFSFDPPGPGREVKLSLTCNGGGCDGSGMADGE